MSNVFKLISYT